MLRFWNRRAAPAPHVPSRPAPAAIDTAIDGAAIPLRVVDGSAVAVPAPRRRRRLRTITEWSVEQHAAALADLLQTEPRTYTLGEVITAYHELCDLGLDDAILQPLPWSRVCAALRRHLGIAKAYGDLPPALDAATGEKKRRRVVVFRVPPRAAEDDDGGVVLPLRRVA